MQAKFSYSHKIPNEPSVVAHAYNLYKLSIQEAVRQEADYKVKANWGYRIRA